jgi:hypothetical protein
MLMNETEVIPLTFLGTLVHGSLVFQKHWYTVHTMYDKFNRCSTSTPKNANLAMLEIDCYCKIIPLGHTKHHNK